MWTLTHVIEYMRIPFSHKQQFVLVIMFYCGLFHPLLTAFTMLYLIFKVAGYLLKKSLAKNRYVIYTKIYIINKISKIPKIYRKHRKYFLYI